jgi:hypothetical protein
MGLYDRTRLGVGDELNEYPEQSRVDCTVPEVEGNKPMQKELPRY